MTEGQYLKKARLKLKMTQVELAAKTSGMHPQQVLNFESGRQQLPVKHIKNITKALNIDPMVIVEKRTRNFRLKLKNMVF